MAAPARLDIRPLDDAHERDDFDCGEPALDCYLKTQASQDRRRHLAQTFCATFVNTQRVIGFYALSAASVRKERLPPPLAKKLPHYPIPAALLGRLATDRAVRGQGIGRLLVADAMLRTLNASQAMGIYGLLVDAKHEQAKAFYERLGFIPLVDAPLRLILPLHTALAAVADINPLGGTANRSTKRRQTPRPHAP
jgi:GNAT superfamily N-acetyltransferase